MSVFICMYTNIHRYACTKPLRLVPSSPNDQAASEEQVAHLATQCAHRAHIAFHTHRTTPPRRDHYSPNSITTIVHTRTYLTRRPQRPQLNLTGLNGVLTICTSLILLGTGQVPGQPRLVRPPAPQDDDPENDTPRTQNTDTPRRT